MSRNYGSINADAQQPPPPVVGFSGGNGGAQDTKELNRLIDSVSSGIFEMNRSNKNLEMMLRTIGTSRDSMSHRENIQKNMNNTRDAMNNVTQMIGRLTALSHKCNKQQKLQVEKLTNDFKDVVQLYGNVQNNIMEKLRKTVPPSQVHDGDDSSPSNPYLRDGQTTAQLRQEVNALEFEKGLLLEREQSIIKIEKAVVDVNQIMKELGAMIHDQGEDIDAIEGNVEHTREDVEAARSELEKAASYVNRRRKRIAWLLGVSIIVGVILAIFIALTFR